MELGVFNVQYVDRYSVYFFYSTGAWGGEVNGVRSQRSWSFQLNHRKGALEAIATFLCLQFCFICLHYMHSFFSIRLWSYLIRAIFDVAILVRQDYSHF